MHLLITPKSSLRFATCWTSIDFMPRICLPAYPFCLTTIFYPTGHILMVLNSQKSDIHFLTESIGLGVELFCQTDTSCTFEPVSPIWFQNGQSRGWRQQEKGGKYWEDRKALANQNLMISSRKLKLY